jgi:hypothetical protein
VSTFVAEIEWHPDGFTVIVPDGVSSPIRFEDDDQLVRITLEPLCGYAPAFRPGQICTLPAGHERQKIAHRWNEQGEQHEQ